MGRGRLCKASLTVPCKRAASIVRCISEDVWGAEGGVGGGKERGKRRRRREAL